MNQVISACRRLVPRSWIWIAVVAVPIGGPAIAQLFQGTIDDNVTDVSHAIVAAAKVTATNEETSFTRDMVTSSAGEYNLPGLPPETDKVTIS